MGRESRTRQQGKTKLGIDDVTSKITLSPPREHTIEISIRQTHQIFGSWLMMSCNSNWKVHKHRERIVGANLGKNHHKYEQLEKERGTVERHSLGCDDYGRSSPRTIMKSG